MRFGSQRVLTFDFRFLVRSGFEKSNKTQEDKEKLQNKLEFDGRIAVKTQDRKTVS